MSRKNARKKSYSIALPGFYKILYLIHIAITISKNCLFHALAIWRWICYHLLGFPWERPGFTWYIAVFSPSIPAGKAAFFGNLWWWSGSLWKASGIPLGAVEAALLWVLPLPYFRAARLFYGPLCSGIRPAAPFGSGARANGGFFNLIWACLPFGPYVFVTLI